ncbi:MAG: hypothetical protein JRE58_06905 [Deltaproteobacteria bacterium]|nr:hypothetical protein [Deltaproteobacteria bacterium]
MAKYKIKVRVEFIECDDTVNHKVTKDGDGSSSMIISEQDAISIDMCEKCVLQTAYPTIREAVSNHLSDISKKKPKKNLEKEEKS